MFNNSCFFCYGVFLCLSLLSSTGCLEKAKKKRGLLQLLRTVNPLSPHFRVSASKYVSFTLQTNTWTQNFKFWTCECFCKCQRHVLETPFDHSQPAETENICRFRTQSTRIFTNLLNYSSVVWIVVNRSVLLRLYAPTITSLIMLLLYFMVLCILK